eukprot:CAMPEP_0172511322 /NCGR_PEP_ID=MMETSP1066-20121228/235496_1 /TAXON_ID=671091 /ORGANISM="Coscinodiscus wailesii, Strain CCMP2513" /LENGTH=249 /DNA_ID=CAMNT_0013290637 /DNA_START=182 /DNA_END=931 /DNA_ORIENTATION=-
MRLRTSRMHRDEVEGMEKLAQSLRAWSVQPGGEENRVGSVAHTIKECLTSFDEMETVDEFLNALEEELRRIKTKLKVTLKLSTGDVKPKLKLKLTKINLITSSQTNGTISKNEPNQQPLPPSPTLSSSSLPNNSFRIKVPSAYEMTLLKKKKTAQDLTPYNGTNESDEEWTPHQTTPDTNNQLTILPDKEQKSRIRLSIDNVGGRRNSATATRKKVSSSQHKRPSLGGGTAKKSASASARDRLKKKLKF